MNGWEDEIRRLRAQLATVTKERDEARLDLVAEIKAHRAARSEGWRAGRDAAKQEADERVIHWEKTCNRNLKETGNVPLYDMGARAEASVIASRVYSLTETKGKEP